MSVENNRDAHVSTSGRCSNRAARGSTRRRFVQGVLAGGVIAGLDLWRWPAWALKRSNQPAVLTGSHFDLVIGATPVNFTGRPAVATVIMVLSPGRCCAGAKATR
jgi:hypothetical protein